MKRASEQPTPAKDQAKEEEDHFVSTATAKGDWFLTTEHLRELKSHGGGFVSGFCRAPTYYRVRDLDALALRVHGAALLEEKRNRQKKREDNARARAEAAMPKPKPKREREEEDAEDEQKERNLAAAGKWIVDSPDCDALELWRVGDVLEGRALVCNCEVSLRCTKLEDQEMRFRAIFQARKTRYTSTMHVTVTSKNRLVIKYSNGAKGNLLIELDCTATRSKHK